MNIFHTDIAYLVIVANAFLLAAAALAILRFSSQCRQIREFWSSPTGVAMAHDGPDAEAMTKVSETVERLERRLVYLQKQVSKLESLRDRPAYGDTRPLPIDNAVQMARAGASVDDLARTCGLNTGEARLMQQLHGRRAATMNN